MSTHSTSIKELLAEEQEENKHQMHEQQPPRQEIFNKEYEMNNQVEQTTRNKKEFFGFIKEFDYKSTIAVFFIVLFISSSIYITGMRSIVSNSVSSDGKTTLIGSLIAAILGTLIFATTKLAFKF